MTRWAGGIGGGARHAGLVVLIVCASLATGCGKHQDPSPPAPPPKPTVKVAPPTPIQTQKSELGGPQWDPQWDRIVEQALPAAMLSTGVPRDVRRFCPRFYQMSTIDKRSFWAYFFQALAGAEAGLDPTTRVRHTQPEVAVKDGVTGRQVRSEGLLQLTYEDQQRYGCAFDWEHDRRLEADDPAKTILQPKNNLECGVKILATQILEQHKPLFSNTGYWSTLRPGNANYSMFAKQMTNVPIACGVVHRPARKALQEEATR